MNNKNSNYHLSISEDVSIHTKQDLKSNICRLIVHWHASYNFQPLIKTVYYTVYIVYNMYNTKCVVCIGTYKLFNWLLLVEVFRDSTDNYCSMSDHTQKGSWVWWHFPFITRTKTWQQCKSLDTPWVWFFFNPD